MAARRAWIQSFRLPLSGVVIASSAAYATSRTVHADAPRRGDEEIRQALPSRKPIYDDPPPAPFSQASSSDSTSESSSPKSITSSIKSALTPSSEQSDVTTPESENERRATPTDRLAAQIKRGRLFAHINAAAAEDRLNGLMTSFFDLETSFTDTIASLAPPKETGERVLPGGIYVLVAAMTGSIITRNRNIVLRMSLPIALGIGAGWAVLPLTMRNVSGLVWKYEERVPAIRDSHLQVRSFAVDAWRAAKVHTSGAAKSVDEQMTKGREKLEELVKNVR